MSSSETISQDLANVQLKTDESSETHSTGSNTPVESLESSSSLASSTSDLPETTHESENTASTKLVDGQVTRAMLEGYLQKLVANIPLTTEETKNLCERLKQLLIEEPTLAHIQTPVTVCGDIHGQFWDLEELFKRGGPLPETQYLFLGDFVDRGAYSIQVVELLLCYKALYPNRVTMLRGNHESRTINQLYGFWTECQNYYGDPRAWEMLNEVFDYFPLAALIDNRIFCVHGGLSPEVKTVDQVSVLNRFTEPASDGPVPDLLWSDPVDGRGFVRSNRGAGHFWGADVSQNFCQLNGLDYIIRAHQLVMEGYEWTHDEKVLTLFSAPNYVYRSGNSAAILKLDKEHSREFIQFDAVTKEEPQQEGKVPSFFV